ncbi:MAG: DUF4190 domain-containing protein [Phycisphaerales bacterium]
MSTFPGSPSGGSPQVPSQTGFEAWDEPVGKPPRVSILAIVALVLSLLCITAPLGLVFGIASLVRIGTSNGRRTGTGLAVAAVIIGLILSSGWAFLSVGAAQFGKFMVQTPGALVVAVSKGDLVTARPYLSNDAAARLDDAAVLKFKAGYEAELGAFKSPPASVLELWSGYFKAGQTMQNFSSRAATRDMMPVPMNFEKGVGVVGLRISPGAGGGAAGPGLFEQVVVVLPSGAIVELFPGGAAPAAPGTPAPAATPDKPADASVPTPPAAKPPGG